jgi:hypothetical protein
VLVHSSSIDLSSSPLQFLAHQLAAHRCRIGSRWRKLDPGRQALLVLAHLRCGDTYIRLAAGFGIGLATVCRYIHEAVRLPADLAPNLAEAVHVASRKAYAILDGTPAPDRPHRRRPPAPLAAVLHQ